MIRDLFFPAGPGLVLELEKRPALIAILETLEKNTAA
jgi:hypothetical protein